MDIVGFAIWKFRTVEGVLLDMHPYDFNTTKYVDSKGNISWIRYNYATENVGIESDDGKSSMTCRFSELADTLHRLGMSRPRPISERHTCTVEPNDSED